ncbi:TetR family transcriptional regulator [Celerinatantimonas sp. MCCC 1A17872]|uniref:TetR family transcriptional regulator n=1 Tax=Celerinatantimonas sp. MCCC 1A17872 TaxID=3177514 RepID=UPI0038CA4DBF
MENQETKQKRTRLSPEIRRKQLLDIALDIATKQGMKEVTHTAIAKVAHASPGTIFNYFVHRQALDEAVAKYIIQQTEPSLVRLEAEITLIRLQATSETELSAVDQAIKEKEFSLREFLND